MKRKLASLLLAVVMTLSLAAPAFANNGSAYYEYADASTDTEQTMTFAATTRVPVISLSLPALTDNPIVFNPYSIEYSSDDDTLNGVAVDDSADKTKQIISPIYDIVNHSDTQLTVGVKATTTVEGNLALVTTENTADTKNTAYVRIDFLTTKARTDLSGATWLKNNAEQKLFTGADTPNSAYTELTSSTIESKKSLPLDSKKAAEIKVTDAAKLVMPKTDASKPEDDAEAGHLLFQFTGSAAKNPTTAWKNTDKFTTVLVLTFQPGVSSNTTETRTIDLTGSDTAQGATSATFSFDPTSITNAGTTPGYTWAGTASAPTVATSAYNVSVAVTTAESASTNAGQEVTLAATPTLTYTNSAGGQTVITFNVKIKVAAT